MTKRVILTDRTPLPAKELFKLKPGDKFVVYWAKDDDSQYVRMNYKTQVVKTNDGKTLEAKGDWIWEKEDFPDLKENLCDTSRGYAYFYKAKL